MVNGSEDRSLIWRFCIIGISIGFQYGFLACFREGDDVSRRDIKVPNYIRQEGEVGFRWSGHESCHITDVKGNI